MDPQSEVLLLAEPFECALQVSTIYFVTAPESTQSDVLKTGAASEPLTCRSCAGVAIRSLIPLLIQIGRRRNPGGAGLVFSASGIWSSLIPLRKNRACSRSPSGPGSLQAIARTSRRPRCQQQSRSEGGPLHRWRARCSLPLRPRRDTTAHPKDLCVRDPWSRLR